MDYLKHGKRKTLGAQELVFIRCDKDGNILSEDELKSMSLTNSTIERIVTGVTERLSFAEEAPLEGVYSQGISTN